MENHINDSRVDRQAMEAAWKPKEPRQGSTRKNVKRNNYDLQKTLSRNPSSAVLRRWAVELILSTQEMTPLSSRWTGGKSGGRASGLRVRACGVDDVDGKEMANGL